MVANVHASVHAEIADLDAASFGDGEVILSAGTASLFLGPPEETLACLARWVELVAGLADNQAS